MLLAASAASTNPLGEGRGTREGASSLVYYNYVFEQANFSLQTSLYGLNRVCNAYHCT